MASTVGKTCFYADPTLQYTFWKVGKIFVGIMSVKLDRVCARKWNAERMIVFNFVILQLAQDINNYAQIRKRILF